MMGYLCASTAPPLVTLTTHTASGDGVPKTTLSALNRVTSTGGLGCSNTKIPSTELDGRAMATTDAASGGGAAAFIASVWWRLFSG